MERWPKLFVRRREGQPAVARAQFHPRGQRDGAAGDEEEGGAVQGKLQEAALLTRKAPW